jgi:hypothetical protein
VVGRVEIGVGIGVAICARGVSLSARKYRSRAKGADSDSVLPGRIMNVWLIAGMVVLVWMGLIWLIVRFFQVTDVDDDDDNN